MVGPFTAHQVLGKPFCRTSFKWSPCARPRGTCVCVHPQKGCQTNLFFESQDCRWQNTFSKAWANTKILHSNGVSEWPMPHLHDFFTQLLCFKPLRQPFCSAHSTLLKGLLGKLNQKFVSFCQNISLGCLWPFAGWKQQFNKLFVCFCGSAGLAAGDSCYESLVLARARLVLQVTLHLSTTYGDSFLVN